MNWAIRLWTDIFQDQKFYKSFLAIALPVMLQNFISSFLNMVDTVMVGKLGEVEIAAVGIANQYFFFFNMFLFGVCAGCGIFIAQFWGTRDLKNIKRILGVGLISAVIVSVLFMFLGYLNPARLMAIFNQDEQVILSGASYLNIALVSYVFTGLTFIYHFALRSIGKAMPPMVISAIALLINIFFNYVLIFGHFGAPQMGVAGAALATVIARIMETIIIFLYIYQGKTVLAATVKELTDITGEFVKKAYRTITPVILNDICWGLASLVYVAVYGRMGTQAVAAVQICNTVSNLFMVVIFGLSAAAAVMVGNSIGAGEEELSYDYGRRLAALSVILSVGLGILLALSAPLILENFNVSQVVRRDALYILYIISIIFFVRALSITFIVGILRGGGDATTAFIIEGITMWLIGVPLTILGAFVFHLPVYFVYALAVIEEITKCLMAYSRFKSKKWINNVTEHLA